uniref:ATP synthase F0 subunit 8 n=1 Tax=Romanomermis culicivorax TaxID=13658 RepID=A0A915IU22_ROMCU
MNQYDLVLPHVTPLMASNRDVTPGWSMTVGWCTLLFSCLTCMIWIKLSYQLASNGSSKVLPTTPLMPP